MAERKYDKYRQYSMTKLMNHLFTFALHRNLIANGCDYNVTANVVELGNISAKTTKTVDGIDRFILYRWNILIEYDSILANNRRHLQQHQSVDRLQLQIVLLRLSI